MYDHSYNHNTLASGYILRKSDFRDLPAASWEDFRTNTVNAAIQSAHTNFNGANPIFEFHLKKKTAYKIRKLEDEIVIRKLALNLKRILKKSSSGRSFLVSNLYHFLEEGLPYKIYRLDVKSFYESFSIDEVKKKTLSLIGLSPLSKRHLQVLLDHFAHINGKGLPRGMAISAILSDFMMREFDTEIYGTESVYFYGRYVDDIIIITNTSENENDFIASIRKKLPQGLQLNQRKQAILAVPDKQQPVKAPGLKPSHKCSFDFLGYQFSVFDPLKSDKTTAEGFRMVRVGIALSKIKKIKLRIVRSFIDFQKTRDSSLLINRIKYLTSNFSVIDKNTGKRKLAGIYHSYPHLSCDSQSLTDLDKFLRNAILSKRGKIFLQNAPLLNSTLKRKLLAQSFTNGHTNRRFIYFSPLGINQIQECWRNE